MEGIARVAVIGSGVMGCGIAAHLANAGLDVVLLDIVPKDAENRNMLAENAVAKALKTDPAPFAHKSRAKRIACGNLEDDLGKLAACDWIIEVVLERLDVKHDVYRKIEAHKKPDAIVSSNTSTLPLHQLTEGFSDTFKEKFLITHFFNPPRYMRLLELVTGPHNTPETIARITHFCDEKLGKGVVPCKDTPGFIANRIGCYWLMAGLLDAIRLDVPVELADAVMGRPVGIPKTAVFGLFDLIGIDLMPLIAQSMLHSLPESDAFCQLYELPDSVKKMIDDGYTGRKGKGGFYRLNREGGKKVKEAIDLKTGEYHPAQKPRSEALQNARAGLAALVSTDDAGGRYARAVLLKTLSYAASLVPEIADDIVAVDRAMRLGYNWKYGPFELIDRLAHGGKSGPQILREALAAEGMPVPPLLEKAGDAPFYREGGEAREYLQTGGAYAAILTPESHWNLAEFKRREKPLKKNGSAALWEIGEGVLCVEFTSKMNSIDPDILGMLTRACDMAASGHRRGLVIANDSDNFCVGANLGFLLFGANAAAWDQLEGVIRQGQETVMTLKYAPFPVVAATTGMALGGGCEIPLHCDAIQAHLETYIGLVEVGVGVIPGWGGCKEMLARGFARPTYLEAAIAGKNPLRDGRGGGPMPVISQVFERISLAKVAKSADDAREMDILGPTSHITMNRDRLLMDARATCLALAENYAPPEPPEFFLPGHAGRDALFMAIEGFEKNGKATPHDVTVSRALAEVLTGGDTDITTPLSEQGMLDLECEHFMRLLRSEPTLARIEHMLETGKPLRN